jgi:hypothetical protein
MDTNAPEMNWHRLNARMRPGAIMDEVAMSFVDVASSKH